MNMKLTQSLLVLLAVFSGCANQVGPVQVTQVVALGPPGGEDARCVLTEEDSILTGAAKLDVAAGDPQVIIGFVLRGEGFKNEGLMLRTGEILEPESMNAPVITSVVINYRLSRRLGATPRTFTQAILVPFSLSGELEARIPVPLISQEFGQQLFDGLQPSATLDDFVDVSVDVEFRGEMDSSKTPFTTGVVTFPIRAARSNPTACGAGQRFQRYPYLDNNGDPDLCNYVGVSYNLSPFAPPPVTCCDPTAPIPGC